MRKITSLLILLCVFVGTAWAQTNYDGIYTLQVDVNQQRGYVVAGEGYLEYPVMSDITLNPYQGNSVNAIENGKNWYITAFGSGYAFYNVAVNKFLVGTGSEINFGNEPYQWNISANGNYLNIQDATHTAKYLSGGCSRTAEDRPVAYDTNNDDGGAKYTITEVENGKADFADAIAAANAILANYATVTVKYVFTYNGVEKLDAQETVCIIGESYPEITASLPFGVSASIPGGSVTSDGAVDGVKTVEIALSVNLPFVPATDNTSIEHWYYLSINGNKLIDYVEGQDAIDLNVTSVPSTVDGRDACTWAFVGNPFDGYKLYNKKAGSTMILSSSTNIDGNGATTFPILIEETAVPDGNNTLWFATASTHQTNGFFLAQKGYDSNKMNVRDNKLAYWTGGADNGSTFTVSERDLTGVTELQALIDQVNAAKVNYVAGTTVGYLTQASLDAVAQAVTDAEAYLASGSVTAEMCADHQSAISDAIAALETIQPEEGKFYNIVSSCTDDHRAGQQVYVNNSGAMHFANAGHALASSMGHVFQFVPGADGKFKIYNVERGVYMQSVGTATETNVNNAKLVTITNMGKDNIVSIKPDGQNQMHAQDAQSKIVGWNNNSYTNGSAWKIVEVADINDVSHPVTITDAEWATLVLGCNTTIPAGVTAYAVSAVGDDYANLAEVTGTIPANEAVLLNAEAGTYEFKYAAESTPVENELVGTVFDTNVEANAYVLSAQGEPAVVGFYKATLNLEENTKFKNNAFKAYLPATAGGEARFLVFNFGDDNATAIENIQGAENATNAVVYDLAGRRVQNAQKGIFIVNGKKVVK
ncbi:MAG: hypothetical protein IKB39_06735 [Bacteroidaceae bacterium]|nr:hypothetical protein [Bacteroidaceae bacterium]